MTLEVAALGQAKQQRAGAGTEAHHVARHGEQLHGHNPLLLRHLAVARRESLHPLVLDRVAQVAPGQRAMRSGPDKAARGRRTESARA